LPDSSPLFEPFHLEHIIAKQHGGETKADNLAWACHRCNRHKGPNLSGIDPETQEIVQLFNPRCTSAIPRRRHNMRTTCVTPRT
jgi:hypothetical protein